MPGVYTRLVSELLFPLHERLKGHRTVAVRSQLEESQWWSPDRLAAFQLQRLQQLVESVYQHVPYYRHLMHAAGFRPADIRGLDDLRRFPLLTKADIRANTSAFKADNAQGLARFNTGGSSGEPLIFFILKSSVAPLPGHNSQHVEPDYFPVIVIRGEVAVLAVGCAP